MTDKPTLSGDSSSPKTAADVVRELQGDERLDPARYYVTMTVSAYVEARGEEDAMQKGCDLVHPLVVDGRLNVHTVKAQWAPDYQPPRADT